MNNKHILHHLHHPDDDPEAGISVIPYQGREAADTVANQADC